MSIGKKIIVEGIDGAGKSHFIQEYIKKNSNKKFKYIHCTRHTPNNYDYFRKLLESEDDIIFDRFMYGQFVYQTRQQREERGQLTLSQLIKLEELIDLLGGEVFYIYSDIETCLYNCKKDQEDSYYTYDYLKELDDKFKYLFSLSALNINYIYNDYHPQEINKESNQIDYKNFDYNSLPKVVAIDFDGTLVTGADYPQIGILNEKLVDLLYNGKYKNYKKILYTHRSGESLLEACNFCADHGIYFDAVNDDIPEIKEILKRDPINNRKVWFDVFFDDKANPDEFI